MQDLASQNALHLRDAIINIKHHLIVGEVRDRRYRGFLEGHGDLRDGPQAAAEDGKGGAGA